MTEDFTPEEQAAIEKAAEAHLEFNFTPADARDIAYDIVRDVRHAVARAAVAELMEVNHLDLDADYEDRYERGACAAIRIYLRHLDKAEGEAAS